LTQPENLEFWIDVNLPPKMAKWLIDDFNVAAKSFWELEFNIAADTDVFKIAGEKKNIIVITTKDIDFVKLQSAKGSPPKILYINVGNISNKELKVIISKSFAGALEIFVNTTKQLVEITI
jgi:predicted nuclease of predicted toxin-antitoxin system